MVEKCIHTEKKKLDSSKHNRKYIGRHSLPENKKKTLTSSAEGKYFKVLV